MGYAAIEAAGTTRLPVPLQNLALPVSAETWNRSLNVAVSAVSEGRPAVALEMDFSRRFNGWCQLNLPAAPEDPQVIRYRKLLEEKGIPDGVPPEV